MPVPKPTDYVCAETVAEIRRFTAGTGDPSPTVRRTGNKKPPLRFWSGGIGLSNHQQVDEVANVTQQHGETSPAGQLLGLQGSQPDEHAGGDGDQHVDAEVGGEGNVDDHGGQADDEQNVEDVGADDVAEDFDEEDDDVEPASSVPAARPAAARPAAVTPPRRRGRNVEINVNRPSNMEDCRDIADTLLAGSMVVLNLEGMDVEVAQRVVDFSSGACYSIGGTLQKVSSYIFILTPANVDVSGDVAQVINGTAVPSIRTNL